MWVLIMVLWVAETSVTQHARILSYDTLATCTSEAERLADDMMTAYPGDTDTWFTCSLETV